ncbi:hypothetical protein F4811DRAFT_565605 [Daldinia bambusicola]|nr:hypothetical protein F4811DRAFT_565605 [Daldinia bambusicola]
MRKLGFVTTLGVVLGSAFDGVFAIRAPIFQQDEAPQAPGVRGDYRLTAPSAGLAEIPGAQVTAGQLVALPGLDETGTDGGIATSSVVNSMAAGTASSTAIEAGTMTSAEVETSGSLTFYRPSGYLLH